MLWSIIVLPAFGGDIISDLWPFPIGLTRSISLEVKSGLAKGDIVVAEGLKKVRPNSKIKPIKDGAKKSKSDWAKKAKALGDKRANSYISILNKRKQG